MRHGVDTGLLQQTAHSPSCFELDVDAYVTFIRTRGSRVAVLCNPDGIDGRELRDHLFSRHQVLIRECGDKLGMSSRFARLVIRPEQDVERLVEGIHDFTRARWTPAEHAGEPSLLIHSA